MEKYQERSKDHILKGNSIQMDKSGDLTSRPKSTLDRYQGKSSATYREICRERSMSNVRGTVPRQSQPSKIIKSHPNATSILRTIDQL